jgi:hypothetical protein
MVLMAILAASSNDNSSEVTLSLKASRAANVQRLSSRKKDAGNQVGITITNFTCFVQSARLHTMLKKRSGLWNSHRCYFDDHLEEATSFRGHQNGHQTAKKRYDRIRTNLLE